ncbi:Transcriptional regulator KdgR [Paraburkholderia caffeinitolerans]|uniref:Transcriptional regulator KdgR n=1 Tax=Paraburkholderia caffeinitolerans TaxID=1723730 RepID=A0A6J5GJ06_9BURK|nr:IclR family transcriptional regulator [Paraburkholderia caffeinitolerans]CAB3800083.1 Transcriptional regulator KdgR [Paraburkholderia caffeinitolerans]
MRSTAPESAQNSAQSSAPALREESATDDARVLRALVVLEQLASAGQPYTLSQLSARLHIPKATLLRLIDSLEARGYVIHMPDSRGHDRSIALGPRAAQLALATLANNTFTRSCRVLLRALVETLGETCNLTALDGDRVLYIERVETAEPLRMEMRPGMHVPLHCTASGKLFLSQMTVLERNTLLERLVLTKMTHRTLTTPKALAAELEQLAVRGIGIDNEEFVRGMVAIAVPVREPGSKRVLAALAVHAPTARATLEELLESVEYMKQTASKLAPLLQGLSLP